MADYNQTTDATATATATATAKATAKAIATDIPEECVDGSQAVWASLHMCLDGPLQYVAFCFAMGSICLWLISHLFLLRARHREGNASRRQFLTLVHICSANLCNVIGARLSEQLGTQVLIAIYFMGADVVFFIHYLYLWCTFKPHLADRIPYSEWKSPARARNKQNGNRTRIMCLLLAWIPAMVYMPLASSSSWQPEKMQNFGPGRKLLMVSDSGIDNFGFTLGVFAIFIYGLAKVPLVKDGLRQEESLLGHVHVCNFSMMANVAYILSIVIYNQELKFMLNALPWLLMSGVCTLFDFILLYLMARQQRRIAREKAAQRWEEGRVHGVEEYREDDASGLGDDGDEEWQPTQAPRLTAIHEEEEDSDDSLILREHHTPLLIFKKQPTRSQVAAAATYSGSDRETDGEATGQRSPIQALPPPPQHPRGGRRQKAAAKPRAEDNNTLGQDLEWDLSDINRTYREDDEVDNEDDSEEDEDVIWDEEMIMKEVEAELKRREAGGQDPERDNVSDISVRSLEFEEIPVDGEMEEGMQDEWFDS
ncbi:uncharacterized protein LOC119745457 isoform X2 [Patiria miniata]|uniref:Uncharacterized protein n=1 Tax=Patiria miniata TaxID=46514 RepID=A0A914BN74_PATMI|nr:uncharacterized protein LOC119745457 isoform X2 [Patiria miniata]